MPRKSAAVTAAAKASARAKAAPVKAAKPVVKPAATRPVKAAPARSAKSPAKPAVKAAAKAAAKSLAAPAAKRAPRKALAATTASVPRDATDARPVLVRDSFTMPEQEYAVLAAVKQACLRAGIDVKKSELLRIGVALLGQVDIATLKAVLAALPQLKTGRPPAPP
ncbi:MAG: hypothetical protein EOP92_05215 [Lysobacteraceae bacterium]|nr:MAG: hypothetical protein EOP92_05215 [Xanthomonadaceae bacterium]